MRQDSVNYLAVGSFVVAMAAVFIAGLFFVGNGGLGGDSYYAVLDEIADIRQGSAVTFGGYPIGKVVAIEPQQAAGRTAFRLTLGVSTGWQIPENSIARITAPGILANSQINITEVPSKRMLEPGDNLRTEAAANPMALVNTMANEIADFSREDLRPLARKLDQYVGQLGDQLTSSVPDLAHTMSETLGRLNDNLDHLAAFMSRENATNLNRILENTATSTAHLADFATELQSTKALVDDTVTQAQSLITDNQADVRVAMNELRRSMMILSRSADHIAFQLESAAENANEFAQRLRNNPAALLSSTPKPDPVVGATP